MKIPMKLEAEIEEIYPGEVEKLGLLKEVK